MKKNHTLPVLAVILLSCVLQGNAQPVFSLSEKGFQITAGTAGTFGFEPPILVIEGGEEKPVFEVLGSDSGLAKYASGMELDIRVESDKLYLSFRNGPASGTKLKFNARIPINFNQGGRVALDDRPAVPFPADLDKQFVVQGSAKKITVLDPAGEGFVLITPGGYFEVQDTRKFNWAIFGLRYVRDIFGKSEGEFELSLQAPETTPAPTQAQAVPSARVDRYGQSTKVDFPGKVTFDEVLKAEGERQTKELAEVQADERLDRFGGLAGSGEKFGLKKTGFFHLGKAAGRDVLVSPEGNVFFQLGVCGIASTDDHTTVKGREDTYEWLPGKDDDTFRSAWREGRPDRGVFSFYAANWIRKFGRPFTLEEWTGQVVDRLRSWGFNSAGSFSVRTDAMRERNFPFVAFLPLGKSAGIPVLPDKLGAGEVLDPFAPDVEKTLDQKFGQAVAPHAGDPLLLGYFLGNEQHFEDLPKLVPAYKASKVPAKRRLVEMLEKKYGTIAAFNEAWNPSSPPAGFDELLEAPLFVRTEAASRDMAEFSKLYLEAYYGLVERVFRKHDPNHLLLGSRWTPGTAANRELVEIGGRHLDVVSVNYYTDAIEKGFLERIHQWSGRPVILSEWYYSTTERGLGAGRQLSNQKERGLAYRNYVEQSAALPFVVGVQWFIYADQALTGRFFQGFHGEGNNTGLVDVADRPYTELVDAASETNHHIYDVVLSGKTPFAFDHPRFAGKSTGAGRRTVQVPRALPGLKLDGTTGQWPGRPAEPIDSKRVAHGLVDENLRADFRLCWDDENFYVHVQVKDPTPLQNTRAGDRIWNGDCVEIFIGAKDLDEGGNLKFSDRQILIAAAPQPRVVVVDHPTENSRIPAVVQADSNGEGYVVQAAIPWGLLGVTPADDTTLNFDLAIDNSNDGTTRHQQLVWSGGGKNSKNRELWGRAQLTAN